MKKRVILSFILMCFVVINASFSVYAYTETRDMSGNTSKSFSPNTFDVRSSSSGGKAYHTIDAQRYSSARIEQINNRSRQVLYYPYIGYYPGMDIKENGGRNRNYVLNATDSDTNYPNPHYDVERNSGRPYNDEVDVVMVRVHENPLSPTMSYEYRAFYDVMQNSNDTGFDVNSEESEPGFSDYNTVNYEWLSQHVDLVVSRTTSLNSIDAPDFVPEAEAQPASELEAIPAEDTVWQHKLKGERFETHNLQVVEKADGYLSVFVDPDPAKLDAYVKNSIALSKKLAAQKFKSVPVCVTFNKPMSASEIKTIVQDYSIALNEYYGRAGTSDDRRTLFGVIKSLSDIDDQMDNFKEVGLDVKGIFALYGSMPAEQVLELQAFENVYLVDSTGYSAIEEAKDLMGSSVSDSSVKVRAHTPYWYIEDLTTLR